MEWGQVLFIASCVGVAIFGVFTLTKEHAKGRGRSHATNDSLERTGTPAPLVDLDRMSALNDSLVDGRSFTPLVALDQAGKFKPSVSTVSEVNGPRRVRKIALMMLVGVMLVGYFKVSVIAVRAAGAAKTIVVWRVDLDAHFLDSTLAMCRRLSGDGSSRGSGTAAFGLVNGEDRFCMVSAAADIVLGNSIVIARLPYSKLIEEISLL